MTAFTSGRLGLPASGFGQVALGQEPPIEADGRRHTDDDRRRVSIRWLVGTVLTGFSGGLLIASAAYTALDQQTHFAEAPTKARLAHKDERESQQTVNPKKGDRLLRAVDVIAAKQSFKTATTVKAGDKEVIRTKQFTHISTTLTPTPTQFADEVPAFNPLKLNTDPRHAPDSLAESDIAPDDAEVSFSTRDFSLPSGERQSAELSPEEAQAQVVEQSKSTVAAGARGGAASAPPPLPGQMLLSRTSRASGPLALSYAAPGDAPTTLSDPFSAIQVRMVAENVTVAPRDAAQLTQMEEKLFVAKHGEGLADMLASNGVPKPRIAAVLAAYKGRHGEPVREGQRVKLLFADFDGAGAEMKLARVSVYNDDNLESMVAATDKGAFMLVPTAAEADGAAKKKRMARGAEDDEDESEDQGGMRLYNSLYETALKQEAPRPTIAELIQIFANDVDLQRSVQPGDTLDIFYDEGEEPGHDMLLYAALTTRGETWRYYRFQTQDDGIVDFYDENGRSSRKFLIRKPIATGETRSGFGMRRHPILGYYKMHTGVDWGAPIGTPIVAAGNGVIIKAQWDSGYGRRVEIQHANGYISTYNHLSGFARHVAEGTRVKQGQVIGFLGSSGLSTGPHLHYEVMVNGHFVDPMRVKLARTREFDGKLLAEFKRERERIDGLMAKAPNNLKEAARK